ncbi:hypothetical protein J6590_075077 [Homalodisca vitripennis]|nr:hypothetical protein J6590_075077 [Homalodisca vitripennis]
MEIIRYGQEASRRIPTWGSIYWRFIPDRIRNSVWGDEVLGPGPRPQFMASETFWCLVSSLRPRYTAAALKLLGNG